LKSAARENGATVLCNIWILRCTGRITSSHKDAHVVRMPKKQRRGHLYNNALGRQKSVTVHGLFFDVLGSAIGLILNPNPVMCMKLYIQSPGVKIIRFLSIRIPVLSRELIPAVINHRGRVLLLPRSGKRIWLFVGAIRGAGYGWNPLTGCLRITARRVGEHRAKGLRVGGIISRLRRGKPRSGRRSVRGL
jgi:hypothetical protein